MPAPSVTEILSTTRILSAAEILALDATGLPITPAPGGSQIISPLACFVLYNRGTFDFGATAIFDLDYGGVGAPLTSGGLTGLSFLNVSRYLPVTLSPFGDAFQDISLGLGLPIHFLLGSGTTPGGGISAASLTAGGTGYAIGDTGTITTGNADATYEVLTVSGLGDVLTFRITFPGSGYATGAGQATATGGAQPGVGINFTVDVTAINNGNGTLKVTTLYQVIDVP